MQRGVAVLAAMALTLAACGGDDSDDTGAAADEQVVDDEAAAESATGDDSAVDTDEAADDSAGDDAGDEPAAAAADDAEDDGSASDAGADDTDSGAGETEGDDAGADDGNGSGSVIRSISDVPQECRDQMEQFLTEIEPLVEGIDWQTAPLEEFEAVADDFEAISNDFDTDFGDSGCDDLNFEGDDEFELIVEFARDVAPGAVGFLEFISAFGTVAQDDGDGGGAADESGAAFTNCDEAVDFVQSLIDQYDTFAEVPASQLLAFAELPSVFVSCTPEQLEFFDSDAVSSFLSE